MYLEYSFAPALLHEAFDAGEDKVELLLPGRYQGCRSTYVMDVCISYLEKNFNNDGNQKIIHAI